MRPICLSCKKNHSPLLIGITGKVGSGKSTAAGFLVDDCMLEYSFASPLKEIAKIIGFDHDQVYGTQEQKLEVNKFWGISGRQFLQVFGTEICRDYLPKVLPDMQFDGKTMWIKLFEKYCAKNNKNDLVVSDVRFSDEAESVKKLGGYIVKIVRDDKETETKQVTNLKAETEQVTNSESKENSSVCRTTTLNASHKSETTTLNASHKSETEMDNIKPHFVIRNNGTKSSLRRKLREVIKSIDHGYADISNVTIYL
jgi:adenylate kinase family enzyme